MISHFRLALIAGGLALASTPALCATPETQSAGPCDSMIDEMQAQAVEAKNTDVAPFKGIVETYLTDQNPLYGLEGSGFHTALCKALRFGTAGPIKTARIYAVRVHDLKPGETVVSDAFEPILLQTPKDGLEDDIYDATDQYVYGAANGINTPQIAALLSPTDRFIPKNPDLYAEAFSFDLVIAPDARKAEVNKMALVTMRNGGFKSGLFLVVFGPLSESADGIALAMPK